MSIAKRLGAWIADCVLEPGWVRVKDIGRVVGPCRFSVVAMLAGFILIVFIPQGQETVLALGERGSDFNVMIGRWLAFWACTGVWAFSGWYWSRVMLSFRFEHTPANAGRIAVLNMHIPRAIGAGAFVAVVIALMVGIWEDLKAHDSAETWKLGVLALLETATGFLFYFLVVKRRDYMAAVRRRLTDRMWDKRPFRRRLLDFTAPPPEPAWVGNWRGLPYTTQVLLLIGLVLALAAFLCGWFFPVTTGELGSAPIVFLGIATWIPIGSWLVYLGSHRRLPVLSIMVGFAVIFGFFNDNHTIRQLPGKVSDRDSLADAFDHWWTSLDHAPKVLSVQTKDGAKRPLIIVATAGGATRAAYWTTTVLGAIDEITELQHASSDHLFALSGVSGGSLGAAVFAALIAERQAKTLPCGQPLAGCARDVLNHDFLAPALASLLYPDLVQRFWPWAMFPDRAEAIERSWEAAWHEAVMTDRFEESVLKMYSREGKWVPALLLNGTWVEEGKRLVMSTVRLEEGQISDAVDLLGVMGEDIRVSTAVNMSARFPLVMPAGRLPRPDPKHAGEMRTWGSIVDGGYFENFGAATAEDLLIALKSVKAKRAEWSKVFPIVILISSDPDLERTDFDTMNPTKATETSTPRRWFKELASPPVAAMNTRDARGDYAAIALRRRVLDDMKGGFFPFEMCKTDARAPALGWVLSAQAFKRIDEYLTGPDDRCHNAAELQRLGRCLEGYQDACTRS